MPATLPCTVAAVRTLRFDDGEPVRAASAITAFEDGWLVVSDDATHAAHWTPAGIARLRVLPPVGGHDLFDDPSGTKHLKPDLEAACRLDGAPAVLLLGSGSLPGRTRAVLLEEHSRRRDSADLAPLYRRVADLLGLPEEHLNLEGACLVDGVLRWFQRGNRHLGVPSGSVDLDLPGLIAAVRGRAAPSDVPIAAPRRYGLGTLGGAALAATDALALPDGRILVSVAAEDTADAVDDGPVLAAALLVLDGAEVVGVAPLPDASDGPRKVEGLALAGVDRGVAHLLAVVDADDPTAASHALELRLGLP